MRDAAQFVLDLTQGVTFDRFVTNRVTRLAVERSFEIMGEAMRRLERHDPEVAATFPEARELVGFRNALAHAYDDIDNARVWRTITSSLPPLLLRLERLIAEIDAGAS